MQDILIKNLMTCQVVSVSPDTSIQDILHVLREKNCSCVVIEERNVPLGIITERDLVRFLTDVVDKAKKPTKKAYNVMSSPPITINDTETLFNALSITRVQKIRHLIVVDSKGELAGLITQSDLVKAYFHILDTQRTSIEESIEQRIRELMDANEKLKALSLEDSLLHIGNRRAMEVDLELTHALNLRYRRPYSVVLFDIDNFKLYNDHYGHPAGDRLLKRISEFLQVNTRKVDRLYRYGGDEILLLLPETLPEGAVTFAERVIKDIELLAIPHCKTPFKVVTISGGIADCTAKGSWREVIADADHGLYQAKNGGRNRISVAAESLCTALGSKGKT
ncbi:MAG: diguanylate cyclase [bacterium]